jgi:hypothetical protein
MSPWKLKNVDFKHNSTKLAVPWSVMFLKTSIAPSMGILVIKSYKGVILVQFEVFDLVYKEGGIFNKGASIVD